MEMLTDGTGKIVPRNAASIEVDKLLRGPFFDQTDGNFIVIIYELVLARLAE